METESYFICICSASNEYVPAGSCIYCISHVVVSFGQKKNVVVSKVTCFAVRRHCYLSIYYILIKTIKERISMLHRFVLCY